MADVATGAGEIVDQGTAERRRFSRRCSTGSLDLALAGIAELAAKQQEAVAELLEMVAARQQQPRRTPPAPRDERDLWRGRAPGR